MTPPSGPDTVVLSPFAIDPAPRHRVGVRVARPQPGRLVLDYELDGDLESLRIPAAQPSALFPTDGLWRHTCMEVFARPAPGGPYVEFNLSPSGQWAAYRFSGYRADMAAVTGIHPPRIELRIQPAQLLLSAEVELPQDLAARPLHLGLTAVLEDCDGQLAYWALRHPGARPDFHHSDSFGFEI